MAETSISLTFTGLEKENVAAFQLIRLKETENSVMLFASAMDKGQAFPQYKMIVKAFSLETETPGKEVFSIPQLLPAPARWDINLTQDNTYQCIAEKAGGAVNSLSLFDVSGKQQSLTEQYLTESFSFPRFIKQKSLEKPSFITAVLNSEQIILLSLQQGADKSTSVMLGDYLRGVLVKCSTGYALFGKKVRDGESRYNEMPGTLDLIRLDDQFEIIGVATPPLSDEVVYEFDVDVLPSTDGGDRFVLFATGKEKLLLAVSTPDIFDFIAVEGEFNSTKIARPAIVATKMGNIYAAAIEELHGEKARLLSGSTAITP